MRGILNGKVSSSYPFFCTSAQPHKVVWWALFAYIWHKKRTSETKPRLWRWLMPQLLPPLAIIFSTRHESSYCWSRRCHRHTWRSREWTTFSRNTYIPWQQAELALVLSSECDFIFSEYYSSTTGAISNAKFSRNHVQFVSPVLGHTNTGRQIKSNTRQLHVSCTISCAA